jgi:hypothetical protein
MTSATPSAATQRTIDEAAGGYGENWWCAICRGWQTDVCTRETCPHERAEEDEE